MTGQVGDAPLLQGTRGLAHMHRFWRAGERDDLDTAIAAFEAAVDGISADSPSVIVFRNNLGVALRRRTIMTGDFEDRRGAATVFRQAVTDGLTLWPEWALKAAVNRGSWALEQRAWAEAAEAFTAATAALHALFATQLRREHQERWLAEAHLLPDRAADASARAGDLGAAVVLLERGRALLLADQLQRDPADVNVVAVGRASLADRYSRRRRTLARSAGRLARPRHGCSGGPGGRVVTHRPQSVTSKSLEASMRAGVVDTGIEAIRAARRELDGVIAEIRAVPGYEDFLAAPTFADVAGVATADHPMVYFAAADLGGLALVVRGEEVTHIPLDDLTAEAVRQQAGDYLAAYDAYRRAPEAERNVRRDEWRHALDEATAWMWPVAVGPVLRELGSVGQVVFVPGGLLGLLPLHAAWTDGGTDSDSDGCGRRYALDGLTITYAPNARALAAARMLAGRPANRLVTVTDPPHAPAVARLAWAPIETSLAEHAMPGPSVRVEPSAATARRVLSEIVTADVAHLASHGFADLTTPLDSGLLLAHGEVLRLRDLLALRSQLRLAVLSACETSMPGTDLPDEVVALPTGLLQAGVGGVVASLWAVSDLSTTLLMGEFYRQWRGGGAPPEALRGAQLWLRDTSNADKARHLIAGIDEGWLPQQPGEALGRV